MNFIPKMFCKVVEVKKKKNQLKLLNLHLQPTADPPVISTSRDPSSHVCVSDQNPTECPARAPPWAMPSLSWPSPAASPAGPPPAPRHYHPTSRRLLPPPNSDPSRSRRPWPGKHPWPRVGPSWPLGPLRVLALHGRRRRFPITCSLDFLSAPANAQVGDGHFLLWF